MPDYNIYIHAIGTGANNNGLNPTLPWSEKAMSEGASPTQAWGSNGIGVAPYIIGASRFVDNPESVVTSATSSIFKGAAVVAAATIVVKTIISVGSKIEDYKALLSGDETIVRQRQDVLQGISNLFNPLSAVVSEYKQRVVLYQENQKRALQSVLFGDSVINRYTNRGV